MITLKAYRNLTDPEKNDAVARALGWVPYYEHAVARKGES